MSERLDDTRGNIKVTCPHGCGQLIWPGRHDWPGSCRSDGEPKVPAHDLMLHAHQHDVPQDEPHEHPHTGPGHMGFTHTHPHRHAPMTAKTPAPDPCPVEAVFGPDDRVPCILGRGHEPPHQYTPQPCEQCGCLPDQPWGCGCSNEDCPCSEAEDEECE